MQSSSPCAVCNGHGHAATHCPELSAPLRSGYVPKTGGPNYGGDDEEDRIRAPIIADVKPIVICV